MKLRKLQKKQILESINKSAYQDKNINIIIDPVFSKQAKDRRRSKTRNNRLEFIRTYSISNYDVHFNEMHLFVDQAWDKDGIYAALGFRGCAKSWQFRWNMLEGICFETYRLENFGIMSEHLKLARKHVEALYKIMNNQHYELLHNDFEFNIHQYQKQDGLLEVNNSRLVSYSYEAGSRGEMSGGDDGFSRLTGGGVDDLEAFPSSRNGLLSRRKYEAVTSDFFLAISDSGIRNIIWYGNYLRERCAIGLHYKRHPKNCLIYPIWDLITHEPTWKEKGYTKEKIEKIREQVGPVVFSYDMECKPVKGEGYYVDYEFDFIPESKLPHNVLGELNFEKVILYMDPASDQKGKHINLKCVTCIGVHNGFYFILGLILSDEPMKIILERTYDLAVQFNAEAFIIEDNCNQWERFVKGDFEMMPEYMRSMLPIEFISNDEEKYQRMTSCIQSKFKTRQVKVLIYLRDTDDWGLFEDEFYNLGVSLDHDDGIDGVTGAITEAEHFSNLKMVYIGKPNNNILFDDNDEDEDYGIFRL